MEQMVLQYEDSTINRFIQFVPVLGEYHITVERFTEPKLSDGHSTFHVKRELIFVEKTAYTNDKFCVLPLPSDMATLCLMLSFDYH